VTNELFDGIAQPRLRALARQGVVRNYRKSTVLIEEGDQGGTIYIVLKGRLKAFTFAPDHTEREVIYGVYGIGDLVGEMSLDGGVRSASVATLEVSSCSVVTRETLRQFISTEPEFAFDLLSKVIAKARQATLSTRSLALTDAYGRLVELLTRLAVSRGDGTRLIPQKLSQAQIAAHIGCTREMVSRLLKDLKVGGYIELTDEKQWVLHGGLPARW
jgi:CRP/FNR family transcriptional regulator, cyclic AMP receptor protein